MRDGVRELTMDEVNFISGGNATWTGSLTGREAQVLGQNIVTATGAAVGTAAATGVAKGVATVVTADLTEFGLSAPVAAGLGAAAGSLAVSGIVGVGATIYYGVSAIVNMVQQETWEITNQNMQVFNYPGTQYYNMVMTATDDETFDPFLAS